MDDARKWRKKNILRNKALSRHMPPMSRTDSLIYYASAQEITNFFSTDKSTQELEKILAEELFVQTYKRLLDIYCKTPTELYVDLVRRYPDFLNYITLREIASFLRVTPETISHIRKNTKGIEFC